MSHARLIMTNRVADPDAVALILHGGASRDWVMRVNPAQLSVLRMIPIARRTASAGRGRIAVARLLNSARGWNTTHTPVDDVDWALQEVRSRFGDVPVGLIGHSLGGRAALLAAGRDQVVSAVALAPWVYPADGDGPTAGRRVLIVHGDRDRIADPQKSESVARGLARRNQVGYIRIAGGQHAMLGHHREFDTYAATFCVATLRPHDPPTERPGPVAAALDGQAWIDA